MTSCDSLKSKPSTGNEKKLLQSRQTMGLFMKLNEKWKIQSYKKEQN